MNPTGLIAVVVTLGIFAVVGVWYRSMNGRVRAVKTPAQGPGTVTLTPEQLGSALGVRATLVQFSSAFCSPCRATRRILTDVAAGIQDVVYVEVDAESNLDLVRQLDVRRTPTTLVLNSSGVIMQRASGQPRKADVVAALGLVIPATIPDVPPATETRESAKSHNVDPGIDPMRRAS